MATSDESTFLTHEDLLKLAEQINCGPLTEAMKSAVLSVTIDQMKSLFENLPDIFEAYDTTMGQPIPASLGNADKAYDNEVTHQFRKDNDCPYFQGKSELCGLDGRVCLYDSDTFPVCPKYKEGFTRHIPGIDGRLPTVPPASEMPKDPVTNQPPFNNPFSRSG